MAPKTPSAAGLRHLALAAALCLPSLPVLAFEQAPSLEAAVKDGKLPPVDQRLPAEPLVVPPTATLGKYGGTWRSGLRGGNDSGWIRRTTGYEGLVRWNRDWTKVIPNIAKSWQVSPDATEFTFELRPGMKWSDGKPFTAEDVAFSFELSEDRAFTVEVPPFMRSPDNPSSAEVVNPHTVKIRFKKPAGMFLDNLAGVNGPQAVFYSKAYCSRFHPKYNPEAEALAKQAGLQSWSALLEARCGSVSELASWQNPERPQLNAWLLEEPYVGGATRVTFVRNPYYFKVDAQGRQLPYIDRLDMRTSESVDELVLLAMNGEIDFQDRHIATIMNKPVFFDNRAAGNYQLIETIPADMNTLILQLNLNHADPVLRSIFGNKDFRIGLSHAIDRQEIIDAIFTGQGQPYQAAPRPESPFYDEAMAKQHTEHDIGRANQHLDKAGLTQKDGEGFRLRPDGKRLSFTVETIAAQNPEWPDMLQLIQAQLREVGVDMQIRTLDRSVYYEKRPRNEFDAQVWKGDGGLEVVSEPRYYFPANNESVWAYRWQAWFNNPASEIAEEPADWAKRQMQLYRQIEATGDPERQSELMRQILAISKEQFPVIGISLVPNGYAVVRNALGNVAPVMKHAWLFPTPAPYDPPQWFFK